MNSNEGIVNLETDYLVIGAGAAGMAFVDEVLSRCKTSTFVISDQLARPGGHWNHAYPFVTLHQGSYFYGVNSEVLERDPREIDLSSKHEMLAYYDKVMRKFLASGRVTFLPQTSYQWKEDGDEDHVVKSIILSGVTYHVTVRKKFVNACAQQIKVPSTHVPSYQIDKDVRENCVPINELGSLKRSYEEFVVIGNGKTGIDAVLYLLNQGVSPSSIRWVVSRELWWYDRKWFGPSSAQDFIIEIAKVLGEEDDTGAIFRRLEDKGILMRMQDDPDAEDPKLFRCATITKAERDAVQNIKEFVRLGHVTRITRDRIVFGDRGSIPTTANTLHVDCTANGLPRQAGQQIFVDHPPSIILRPVITCNVTWSSAVIGMLEVLEGNNEDAKRSIIKTIPHPEAKEDWVAAFYQTFKNLHSLSLSYRKQGFDGMRLSMLNHGPILATFYKEHFVLGPVLAKMLAKADSFLKKYEP
mmetsp:Transcript_6850/g.23559  ORF Transcript_6850/g.23559 Transcript_6850/m.23559 type:complete len:469 (-) Transcript_6850:38-1444(-)